MAKGKGVQIPVGIDFDSKGFVQDITMATSAAGKKLEQNMSVSVGKAMEVMQRFKSIQTQILATGSMPQGMDSKSFRALQSANTMAESFLRTYNQVIEKGNQFSDVYTTAYANLEQKADSYRSKLQTLDSAMEQTKNDIEQITQAQLYMNDPKSYDAVIEREDYLNSRLPILTQNLKKREEEIHKINQEWHEGLRESGVNLFDDKQYKTWATQIQNVRKELEGLEAQARQARELKFLAQDMTNRGLSADDVSQFNEDLKYQQQTYDDIRKAIEGIRVEQEKLAQQGQKFAQVGVSPEEAQRVEKAGSSMMQYASAAEEAKNNTRRFGDSTRTATRHTLTLKKVVSSITKVFKSMIKHLSQIRNHMNKSFDSSQNGMKQALRNVMRYGLGVRSLYFLFRRLRAAAKDAFGVMAQQWEPVNKQISSMIQSLNGVKGSIATMLQPLLASFTAFFNQFMGILQKIMEAIGAFFAFLTGQNYILRAKAGGVDWADHLADKLGQAKDEAEELNKQLAGFDKINNLTTKDDKDSGSGKSDIGLNTVTFEKVPLEQLDIFNWLKDMWLKSDFGDLGRFLNEKLLGVLQKIDWDEIERIGRKIGTCIATAVNGFFENDALAYEIGEAIAGWLNTKFATIYEFASRVEWDRIGVFIVTGIRSFFENAKFGEWGSAAQALIGGLIEAIYVVVTNKDIWKDAGDRIIEGINGFLTEGLKKKKVLKGFGANHVPIYEELNNFQMAGGALSGFVTNLLDTMTSILSDDGIWIKFGQAIGDFISGIDWKGVFISLKNFALALLNAMKKAVTTAYQSNPLFFTLAVTIAVTASIAKTATSMLLSSLASALATELGTGATVTAGAAGSSALLYVTAPIAVTFALKSLQIAIDNAFRKTASEEAQKAVDEYDKAINTAINKSSWGVTRGGAGGAAQISGIKLGTMIANKLFGSKQDLQNEAESTGADITSGVLTGAENQMSADTSKWDALWGGLEIGARRVLETHSPSKVFMRVAQDVIAGFLNPFNTLSQRFSAIWENVKYGAISALNNMRSSLSSIASSIIGVMNSLSSSVSSVISNILNSFNRLSGIEVNLSGASSGAILGTRVKIPHLAKGAVIPPNNQFLAMLGDQKSGTNIEAPLSTIEDAVRNVLAEQNINVTFEVQGDPEHIFNVVRKQSNQFTRRTGLSWT